MCEVLRFLWVKRDCLRNQQFDQVLVNESSNRIIIVAVIIIDNLHVQMFCSFNVFLARKTKLCKICTCLEVKSLVRSLKQEAHRETHNPLALRSVCKEHRPLVHLLSLPACLSARVPQKAVETLSSFSPWKSRRVAYLIDQSSEFNYFETAQGQPTCLASCSVSDRAEGFDRSTLLPDPTLLSSAGDTTGSNPRRLLSRIE